MGIRLAFAAATTMAPDILLMDEWFLAGDADFIEKASRRLEELVSGAEILVLATHDMSIVRKWCTRVFEMAGGHLVADKSADSFFA
jgi:lipopolysaccharide transport system ATP-binding protein